MRRQKRSSQTLECHLIGEDRHPVDSHHWGVELQTSCGLIDTRYHPAVGDNVLDAGVVWVGGAGGGLDGPAQGLYPAVCQQLQEKGIAGLRLHYRLPNDLPECVMDTLLGIEFLVSQGVQNVGLVGHSFGGAVVITAGALSSSVRCVVPMSTQTYGAELASELAPRALLLIHGGNDEVLPDACSKQVYANAGEPKEIKIFPGARHGLDECREEVLKLLTTWLPAHLATNEPSQ